MVMDGNLQIDEHTPIPELEEAMATTMKQVETFREAASLVDDKDFESAIELIEESELPEGTRTRLVKVLETGEWDLIDGTFADYKGRLGQAFCEDCWKG